MKSNRRSFLKVAASGSLAALYPAIELYGNSSERNDKRLDAQLVQEFVRVAHESLEEVEKMVSITPNLLNSAWDWGNGDYETAIGAAAHMGLIDMVNYLIDLGARPNIFTLTTLGKSEIVMAIIEEYPAMLHAIGPHGYTLLHHAEQGGENAEALYNYLKNKGLEQTIIEGLFD